MGNSGDLTKRALNVAYIVCNVWATLVFLAEIIPTVIPMANKTTPWNDTITMHISFAVAGYLVLATVSYILFGRVIFWHKFDD